MTLTNQVHCSVITEIYFSILLYLVSSIEVSFFGAQQMVDALVVVTAWDMFMVIYGLQMFWQAKALS